MLTSSSSLFFELSMRALFKGAKLEVESVIREVTERVLYDQSVGKETRRLRATALGEFETE